MTHSQTNNALYPGMIDNKVEFFAVEGGMKFIKDSEVQCTTKMPYSLIQLGYEEIAKEPEVEKALQEWHPNSKFNQLQQFLKCRYGGLDFSADMENNQFKEGDYWNCPSRKTCPFNGIICKAPKVNGHELTVLEIDLMILKSTNKTNQVIADELNLAFGSFHKASKILYQKLGVQTRQEITVKAHELNLI
jgi:DNA-binding CsgD family transcriptional regulator